THASRANHFNSVDYLGVQRKYALDSMSEGYLTDSERCPCPAVFLSDENAFEDPTALFIAFFDLYVDFNRISRSDVQEVRSYSLFLSHIECIHKISKLPQ